MHNPASVLENDTHKLLWDFEIQTDQLISARVNSNNRTVNDETNYRLNDTRDRNNNDSSCRNNKTKNRNRKVIWFNPAFCKSSTINIDKYFPRLIDKHFNENNPLKKI